MATIPLVVVSLATIPVRFLAGKEDCILLDFTDRLHSLDKESDLVTSENGVCVCLLTCSFVCV